VGKTVLEEEAYWGVHEVWTSDDTAAFWHFATPTSPSRQARCTVPNFGRLRVLEARWLSQRNAAASSLTQGLRAAFCRALA
jgi:hypothetical protein